MSQKNKSMNENGNQQQDAIYWPNVTQGTAKISRKGKKKGNIKLKNE